MSPELSLPMDGQPIRKSIVISLYDDEDGISLSAQGQRLQQGMIQSSTIIKNREMTLEERQEKKYGSGENPLFQGFLTDASNALGLPNDAEYWVNNINPVAMNVFNEDKGKRKGKLNLVVKIPPVVSPAQQ